MWECELCTHLLYDRSPLGGGGLGGLHRLVQEVVVGHNFEGRIDALNESGQGGTVANGFAHFFEREGARAGSLLIGLIKPLLRVGVIESEVHENGERRRHRVEHEVIIESLGYGLDVHGLGSFHRSGLAVFRMWSGTHLFYAAPLAGC